MGSRHHHALTGSGMRGSVGEVSRGKMDIQTHDYAHILPSLTWDGVRGIPWDYFH